MYIGRQYKNEAGNKVSRQVDCGGAQQMMKMIDGRRTSLAQKKFTQFPNEAFFTQKNAIETNIVNSNVIQNVLVTDVPNTGDFSQVTDLGIWWAMAAEYKFQQNLPVNAPNTGNLNPLDYIFSLSDYVNIVPHPQINVAQGDRVRMLTHGKNPNQQPIHLVYVGAWQQSSNSLQSADLIVSNINKNIANGQQVTPLYCYMGNNPNHANLISGIGQGPMLAPTYMSVSLQNNISGIQKALLNAGNANTWRKIIDNEGGWMPIDGIYSINQCLQLYKMNVQRNGAKHLLTINALKNLLTTVYNEVNGPYNDFAKYLIQQNLSTGQGNSLWA